MFLFGVESITGKKETGVASCLIRFRCIFFFSSSLLTMVLLHMAVNMLGVEEFPQMRNLPLRVEPHQVHMEVRVGFIFIEERPFSEVRNFSLFLSGEIHKSWQ